MTKRHPIDGALSSIYLQIEGQDMPAELFQAIEEIVVESSLQLPDVASITFRDPLATLLDDERFKLGTKIKVISQVKSHKETVFDGELVEIEPRFTQATQQVRLRAFDRMHRLARGHHTRSFQNVTDMDLVKRLASEVGLQAEVGPASVVHPYVLQHNQSNLSFLRERATRLGYVLFVDGQTLHCEPLRGVDPIELTWGDNLYEFLPRLTSLGQTSKGTVRSWNPEKKKAVLGEAESGKGKPEVAESSRSEQVAPQAFKMKAPTMSHTLVVRDQAYADLLAQAQRNVVSEQLLEAQGTSAGFPRMTAGVTLNIKNVGQRFSGAYVTSSVRHLYRTAEGYSTEFVVSGSHADSLAYLIRSATARAEQQYTPVPGLMLGIVTNNKDPKDLGRVRLKLPTLSEDDETDWARIVSLGNGHNRGTHFIPEVNDEVLVGFEHDDIHHPYVLGGLWNGQDQAPYKTDKAVEDGKVVQRAIRTRLGHEILFEEPKAPKAPTIKITSSQKHEIVLNDDKKKPFIEIKSKGNHRVMMMDDPRGPFISVKDPNGNEILIDSFTNLVQVRSLGRLELSAQSGISIDGGAGNVDIRGVLINLN